MPILAVHSPTAGKAGLMAFLCRFLIWRGGLDEAADALLHYKVRMAAGKISIKAGS